MAEEVPFQVVQIEGKGRGLVATRTLEIGELVLSEKAFLKISPKSNTALFLNLACTAEPDIRSKLMNLSCSVKLEDLGDENKVL